MARIPARSASARSRGDRPQRTLARGAAAGWTPPPASAAPRGAPGSRAEAIDRARRDDVMIYAIGMRSRGARPMMPGIGPGGLQAMVLADLPHPRPPPAAPRAGGARARGG